MIFCGKSGSNDSFVGAPGIHAGKNELREKLVIVIYFDRNILNGFVAGIMNRDNQIDCLKGFRIRIG